MSEDVSENMILPSDRAKQASFAQDAHGSCLQRLHLQQEMNELFYLIGLKRVFSVPSKNEPSLLAVIPGHLFVHVCD